MQYVHRPAQPWAIGTIASCQPSDADSTSAARSPHAVPAPIRSTICIHFRGGRSWEPGDDRTPPPPEPGRPVLARTPPARAPEHELRDRAKAAKLRHKAAKARMKASRMTERAHHLNEKATHWERRANDLDGVVASQT